MTLSIVPRNWDELSEKQRATALRRPGAKQAVATHEDALAIVAAVRKRGDDALFELSKQYDNATITRLKVSDEEIAAAARVLTNDQLAAIDTAIENIRCFHTQQLPQSISIETAPGVVCERISQPLDSVGLYVPAGSAPLPSAAIMLAVPAVLAGCPKILLCTPPRPDGRADPAVLVAASRAGIRDIYSVGGAQAIAAMAYGTESIPRVRKILGPGNAWVTAAKTIVCSDPNGAAIDMPAGPSEVLIVTDASASAEFVAADLLSQAEHGSDSQVLLVTTDEALARDVLTELNKQLPGLSRMRIAADALQNARILIANDIATAISISNRYAPEHLILQLENPRRALASVRNAGSVFLGQWTPEAVGDYCSGTNHVLPTDGYAATYSGLGVEHYMRQMTVQEVSAEGLQTLAPTVLSLATLEGLDAHAAAVSRRLQVRP